MGKRVEFHRRRRWRGSRGSKHHRDHGCNWAEFPMGPHRGLQWRSDERQTLHLHDQRPRSREHPHQCDGAEQCTSGDHGRVAKCGHQLDHNQPQRQAERGGKDLCALHGFGVEVFAGHPGHRGGKSGHSEGDRFINNGGANYIATFATPEPSKSFLLMLGILGVILRRLKI